MSLFSLFAVSFFLFFFFTKHAWILCLCLFGLDSSLTCESTTLDHSVHHFTLCDLESLSVAATHVRFDAICHHLGHPACFRQGKRVGRSALLSLADSHAQGPGHRCASNAPPLPYPDRDSREPINPFPGGFFLFLVVRDQAMPGTAAETRHADRAL